MELKLLPILLLLGAAQGAFLSFSLIANVDGNRRANRYLAALVAIFSVVLFDYFLEFSGLMERAYFINVLLWPKEFLFGVLLYLYCREMVAPDIYHIKGKQWRHFIPTICHALVSWPLLFFDESFQRAVLSSKPEQGLAYYWEFLLGDVETVVTLAHTGFYAYLSMFVVLKHRQKMLQQLSSIEKVSLDWLRNLLFAYIGVYCLWVFDSIFFEIEELIGLALVIFVYLMGYLGLRQPKIFASRQVEHNQQQDEAEAVLDIEASPIDDEPAKYQTSSLSDELSEALNSELQEYMKTQRPYLEPELSLPTLSQSLGVSVNYMSQVINQQTGLNFFDFINGYRIEEAKRLMAQGTKMNLLEIGLAAGFNAKSSFYTAFKKHTDMTPGAYKKSLTT